MSEIYKLQGYTLIELLVVVVLISFVMAFLIPHTDFSRTLKVRAELETMYTTITYLYQCALASSADQHLYFDVAHNSYTYHEKIHQLDDDVRFGFLPDTKGPPSDATYTLTTPVTFQDQCIVCSAQGTLSAGVVYVTDKKQTVMYALAIPIGMSSVRKYRFDNKWVLMS